MGGLIIVLPKLLESYSVWAMDGLTEEFENWAFKWLYKL